MKPTPLFLKIRGSTDSPQLHLCADNAISFQDKKYEFSSIFHDAIPADALQLLKKTSATLILVGPTASGKTTSLLEIVRFFAGQGANVLVNACEINKNKSFVDLLDENASKRYLSSLPFDNQLKKMALDSRVVSKIMKEKSGAISPVNTVSSRSCLLVNIYHDSKMLTIVDMLSQEKLDARTANSGSNSNTNSSSTRHGLHSFQSGRSQNLISNLIFRRVSSSNISFVMHLDQAGDPDLIGSSLANITQTVKTFCVVPKTVVRTGISSVSRSEIPNYAKPTVSSATPSRPLSSYKVSKPTKKCVCASVDKSTEVTPRQRALLRQRTSHASPINESRELKQLRETVVNLQRELVDGKASYLKSIETLQLQMRSIKNESLVNLQTDLLTTRTDFERVSVELQKRTEIASLFEEQITQLHAEKSIIDSRLADTLHMLDEKTEELTKAREVSADEKRSLAAAFETELNLMREASTIIEEKIDSLTQSNNEYGIEVSRLTNERDELRKETENLLLQISQKEDERKLLEENMQNTQRLAVSGEESTKALRAEISEKLSQIEILQQQLSSERSLLAEKTSGLVEHMEMNKQNMEKIESLEKQTVLQQQERSEKEEFMRQKMDSVTKENKEEIERVENLVNDITSKYGELEKMRETQRNEMAALRESLEQKEIELAAARKYQDRSIELESTIQEMSRKSRQQEIEYEKQVLLLNEELLKARAPATSPKKLLDFPELDFNHDNNTFSSIDIFEDQTDYMMFRRPTAGRSPIPSPTRVLTEANSRANTDPKPVGKHAASGLQLPPTLENLEAPEV